MEINKDMVNELRQATGAGMMDCKKALVEASGDMDEATKVLRKKGLAAAAKKAGRAASEGLVSAKLHPGAAVLLEVNCETDFVAKTEDFQVLVDKLSERIAVHAAFGDTSDGDVAALAALSSPTEEGATVGEALAHLVGRLGENMSVRRFARWIPREGESFSTYIHGNGRIGVVVGPLAPTTGKDVAMHVAAAEPRLATRADVPARRRGRADRPRRRRPHRASRPRSSRRRGGVEKFMEAVPSEQTYVRDDKQTVGQVLRARVGEAALGFASCAAPRRGLARRENDCGGSRGADAVIPPKCTISGRGESPGLFH
jgi:elongation factor Ts